MKNGYFRKFYLPHICVDKNSIFELTSEFKYRMVFLIIGSLKTIVVQFYLKLTMKGIAVYITLLSFMSIGSIQAQDPFFTQTVGSILYANPAFTGSAGQSRVQAAQRVQWPGIPGTFYTTQVAADFTSDNLALDFGLNYIRDQAGEGNLTTQSYILNVGRAFTIYKDLAIRIGASGSFNCRSLDWSKLTFGDQIDSRYGFIYGTQQVIPNSSIRYINFNVGAVIHSNTFLISYAMHNANSPSIGFIGNSRLPMRHTVHGALRIFNHEAKRSSKIYLTALYRTQQDFTEIRGGASFQHGKIKLGVLYRNGDALIGMIGFTGKRFVVGYSYDYTVSRLTNATAGSHELSLTYLFGKMKEERPSISWTRNLF